MKGITIIWSVFFFVLSLLDALVLNAQPNANKIDKMVIVFKGNHIALNFSMLSCKKASLSNQSGNHPVSTAISPGILLGFNYQITLKKGYSLKMGPEVAILSKNFLTSIDKNDFSPPLTEDFKLSSLRSLTTELIFRFPVLLQKRWLYTKTKYVFVDAGISLNYSIGADLLASEIIVMNTDNNFYNVGGVDVNANNDQKPWISYPVNAGHAWLLKNNCLLQLAVCSNISFTKFVDGSYHIDIPGKPLTTGRYSSTGSYIGLSLNYVFTNANYRIRKMYEKR